MAGREGKGDSPLTKARKDILVLLALVLASASMLVVSTRNLVDIPENVGLSILTFFQGAMDSAGDFFSSTVTSIAELKDLKNEYTSLLAKLESYRSLERGIAETRAENLRLKEQLGFSAGSSFHTIPAEIIAKDPGNLYSTVVINKGSQQGIKKNMAVIAFQGGMEALAGRIVEVGRFSSIVLPIFDSRSFVAARLERSRYEGLLGGLGSEDDGLLMEFVKKRAREEIQFGDLVVTTGYDSSYPKDIALGRVTKLEVVDYKTSIGLRVEPILDFSRLEYVFVIIPESGSGE